MALKIICDGCGEQLEDKEVMVRGLVIQRQYCEGCAGVADTFSATRDEVHTGLAKRWAMDIKKLHARFTKDHPDFTLPDA